MSTSATRTIRARITTEETLFRHGPEPMNFATQQLHPATSSFTPFQPQSQHEKTVATVIRMMLRYELLRVQLESKLTDADENQRVAMRDEAIRLWVDAFRLQHKASETGMPFSYDEELLRREAVRIAYLLVRKAVKQARMIEEATVTISVTQALYGIDVEVINIPQAA